MFFAASMSVAAAAGMRSNGNDPILVPHHPQTAGPSVSARGLSKRKRTRVERKASKVPGVSPPRSEPEDPPALASLIEAINGALAAADLFGPVPQEPAVAHGLSSGEASPNQPGQAEEEEVTALSWSEFFTLKHAKETLSVATGAVVSAAGWGMVYLGMVYEAPVAENAQEQSWISAAVAAGTNGVAMAAVAGPAGLSLAGVVTGQEEAAPEPVSETAQDTPEPSKACGEPLPFNESPDSEFSEDAPERRSESLSWWLFIFPIAMLIAPLVVGMYLHHVRYQTEHRDSLAALEEGFGAAPSTNE